MEPRNFDPHAALSRTPITRRTILGGMLGGAAALALAACGDDDEGSSATTGASSDTGAPGTTGAADTTGAPGTTGAPDTTGAPGTTGASADWEAEWEQLILDARAEGELVAMFGATTAAAEEAIREEFTKQFGIKWNSVPGSATDITNRVIAERSQGIYSVDIASLGSSAMGRMLDAKSMTPLIPQLIIPDTIDRSQNWYIDYIPWALADVDAQFATYYAVVASRNVQRIYYNTDNVSADEIAAVKSWNDFLKPEWKGRLGIEDLVGGSELQRNQLWIRLGKDYVDQLFHSQEITVWAQGADVTFANAIVNGDLDVILASGGAEGALLDVVDQGLPLAEWPNTLEEGPAVDFDSIVGVMDQPPHPNAAKLYVNWMLSKMGGEAFNSYTNRPLAHLRSDAPQGALDDETWNLVQTVDFSKVVDPNGDEYRQVAVESLAYWTDLYAELGVVPSQ